MKSKINFEIESISMACFISPHGFGHAARAAAVMESLCRTRTGIRFDIYTAIPEWFFAQSLSGSYAYHHLNCDIGLVQLAPLEEDLDQTLRKLDAMLPFDNSIIQGLAEEICHSRCRLILCDIAPMGIAAANAAGIPAVLIENFTWDWIYQAYAGDDPRIVPHIDYLRKIFTAADHHIQTEPVCSPAPEPFSTLPVSRSCRTSSDDIRRQLNIPQNAPLVLVTMGGIPYRYEQAGLPADSDKFYAVVPGASDTYQIKDNIRLLPHRSRFFHPDLVNASDAVIGKLGYSTLAEVFQAGVPFGHISRPGFRESPILENYIRKQMHGLPLSEDQLLDGSWIERIPDLLAMPKMSQRRINGAQQAAEYILDLLT